MQRRRALLGATSLALASGFVGLGATPSSASADVAVMATPAPAPPPVSPPKRDPNRIYRSDSPFRFGTVNYSKWYARQYMAKRYRWGADHYRALVHLWTRESGWQHRARNPSSGAYGIPQALPAGKMSSSGSDWSRNPETQIRWGLGYIRGRYGTPTRAYAFFRSHNWY